MKRQHIVLTTVLAVTLSIIIVACGNASASSSQTTLGTPGVYTCVQGKITVDGSTALQRLVQTVAKKYQTKCKGSNITVNGGGSGTGLKDVEAGKVAIGNSDIFANKSTQADLVDHQVAIGVFGIVINAKVGIKDLTTAQIKDIFSGKDTNWKDLGGPDMPIFVLSRPDGSGTRVTFEKFVLGGPQTVQVPASQVTDNTKTVLDTVAQTDGAIGYASSSYAASYSQKKGGEVVATIDGNAPTPDLVKSNTYKFWNIEHMYTKGQAPDLAQALIDYMAGPDGVAASRGYLAINTMSQAILQTRQS